MGEGQEQMATSVGKAAQLHALAVSRRHRAAWARMRHRTMMIRLWRGSPRACRPA